MAIYRNKIVDVELETGTVFRTFVNHALGKGDSMGNRYGMRLLRNGQAVTLTNASVTGLFCNSRGEHILISGASYTGIDGNVAWVQLPQACYNYEGQFTLSIKVTDPDVTETMLIIDGTVVDTGSDNPIAPTGSVPTYEDIIDIYNEMVEIVGVARDQHGDGNANQVDGYHAIELLPIINGTARQLIVQTGDISIEAETLTNVTFTTAFPAVCLGVWTQPLAQFAVMSTVSVQDIAQGGFSLYLASEDNRGMGLRWIAFGY